MELIPESSDLKKYLECTELADFDSESVRGLARSLGPEKLSGVEKVGAVYEYMQANVPHTFNTTRKEVARTASEVIRHGHGICYAKANLAAALLRSSGIPAGYCYQKFRMDGTPDSKFVVHCLNGVYLEDCRRWIRIDFRNPAEGSDPAFRPGRESGLVAPDVALGERDYPVVHVNPHPATVKALEISRNADELKDKLPESL